MTTSIAQIEIPTFSGVVKPVAALLLYETEQRVIGTLHPLTVSRRGQAVLGVGRPFSQRDVQDLLALLAGQHPPKTFDLLPAHLLAHGEEVLVWWRPGQVRPMWFLLNGQRFGFRVPWPSLVFVAHRQGLWCAALAQKAAEAAVVAERTRLARDLHDAVTQTLFSASLTAEALLKQEVLILPLYLGLPHGFIPEAS